MFVLKSRTLQYILKTNKLFTTTLAHRFLSICKNVASLLSWKRMNLITVPTSITLTAVHYLSGKKMNLITVSTSITLTAVHYLSGKKRNIITVPVSITLTALFRSPVHFILIVWVFNLPHFPLGFLDVLVFHHFDLCFFP